MSQMSETIQGAATLRASVTTSAPAPSAARDVVALTKPRITAMAGIVAAGAMLLAPGTARPLSLMLSLLGILMAVAGAGALNMLVERDVDALMTRTALRPLPTGRLPPVTAFALGAVLSLSSLPLLYAVASPLTAALTAFSLFAYVLVYTPMKRTSPWSLVVGAVPGAMPALMGSSSVAGRIDTVGLSLFFVVFLWQVPHFLAISIYREPEYVAAGHKVVSARWGIGVAKVMVLASTVPLALLGVALWPLGLGSALFAAVAAVLGAAFVWQASRGFQRGVDVNAWARRVFFYSLIYQTLLFGALAADFLVARFVLRA